jgi:hypothetical protein
MRHFVAALLLLLLSSVVLGPAQAAADDDDDDVSVDTGISIVSQTCDVWCWAASIEMIAQKYGVTASQCEIVSARFAAPCCQPYACFSGCDQAANGPLVMTEGLQAFNIHGEYQPSALSSIELRSVLSGGSPVLAATVPHAFVVSGYHGHHGHYLYKVLDPFPLTGEHWVSYAELITYEGNHWSFSWFNFE